MEVGFAADNIDGDAVKLARTADVAIVCVGNHPNGGNDSVWGKVSTPSEGREAVDRQSITLEQEELVKQVYQANPRTIVVLVSSFPYAINWTDENVPAILHLALNSQEEGNALADVLFGEYNPAGRLVQTWPKSLEQLPPMMDYDIRHGRTYMYFKGSPLYPFGYGLSYTTFGYANLRTSAASIRAGSSIRVSVDIRNTGRRAGEEVVQLYLKYLNSSVPRPIKALQGFKRIALRPGEIRTVTLELKAEQLAYWNVSRHKFVLENGAVQLMIGGSSADIKLTKTINVR
jgi:beta-glucosidase